MSFDSSVEIWLEAVHDSSEQYAEESAQELPIETLALRVGSEIFGCAIYTTADLAATVAENMDVDITSLLPGIMNISKLCLLHAVSSNCERRAEFVQGIISLDAVVQSELMQIIKGGAGAFMAADALEDGDEGAESPLRQTRKRDREETAECKGCGEKAKEMSHLQTALRRAVEKEEEDSLNYHRELSLRDNKLMDVELQLMQRDERIAELQQSAEQSLASMKEQQLEMEKSNALVGQIRELQDEIDCLKPRAERVDALEATTERLKLKLDEMSDLKQQLAAEGAAHSKTQNKYVDAMRELDVLRKTKAQLEEYRSKCTELEIAGNELSIKLSLVTKELDNLSGKNEHLSESQRDKAEETQRLREELVAAQARLREVERGGGIGQGMSELNPELMMELTALRSENEKLSRQLNLSAVESLEQLEKQLEDAKSINTSLQAKWMETKDLLAESRAEASTLAQSVNSWSLRFHTLEREHGELQLTAEEDRIALLSRQAEMARLSDMKHQAELAEEIFVREAIIETTRNLLEDTKKQLCDTTSKLEAKCSENVALTGGLNDAQIAIANMEQQIAALKAQHEHDMVAAKDNHTAIVDLLKQSEVKRVEEIERKHSSALKAKEIEISSVSSELDAEKKKRRRVEKEKRFLDGEVHRYKTQAQINSTTSSGSSEDVAEILKEMKSMQKSLDTLGEENAYLKNQVHQSASRAEAVAPCGEGMLKGGAGRVLDGGTQRRGTRSHPGDRSASTNPSSSCAASYGDYLEQTEISDKRMEQLVREKREIMAKNLEESKEKMELAQKLLQSERENTQLKSKVTKLTLENERYQRKAMMGADKAKSLIARAVTEENQPNLASNYPPVKKSLL